MENRDIVKKIILNEATKKNGNIEAAYKLNKEANKEKIKQERKKGAC